MKNFLYFLIHSNIYLALGSSFLPIVAYTFLHLPILFQPVFIVFATTFFLYHLNRKTDIKEDVINYPERVKVLKKYGKILFWFSFVIYLIALSLAFSSGIKIFLLSLIPLLIMISYSIFKLKKYFIIKNMLASFGWASSFLLSSAYFNLETSKATLIIFFFYFLRGLVNTIICDIRDIEGDKLAKISTLPIKIGVKRTKKILYLLNFISFILIITSIYFKLIPGGYILSLVFLYGIFYISRINYMKIKFLSELVDGELYILGLLALIERLVFKLV